MRTSVRVVLATLALAVTAGTAQAQFKVKPGIYDPNKTRIISSAWVAHEGLPDAGNANHALYMAKLGPTTANAAAFASLDGVNGIMLTELGFDVRLDGHCGAGAPRFNVLATDGFHFMGGCSNMTFVGSPAPGWARMRLTTDN